ncbi:VOC family protein [Alkalicaulis satelles]|uniref:VOC family protein n=1 Tax=Alkalicaulis satelles TaxID=2609175 RepID=A0A5M6ZLB2_9PROT|nr:VOC family protein [Alkalicaulis satelles]KAA5804534.1 VOC family protein [Alkalicaulis satelles]
MTRRTSVIANPEPVIEHVNLTIADPEHTHAMLQAVFGWRERWRDNDYGGRVAIHVGGPSSYVALYGIGSGTPARQGKPSGPFNHFGVVVSDLDACEARVRQFGLKPYGHADYEPGRRFYFEDLNGVEYEVASY